MPATAAAPATALAVTANRAELIDCLAAIAPIANPKFKPVLGCVRIVAANGELQLDTTDLSTRLRRTARQLQVDGEGTVCVPARDLLDLLRKMGSDLVKITEENGAVFVRGDDGSRKFYTQSPNEFPPNPPEEKDLARYVVPVAGLRLAHGFVSHAVAKANTRYAFTGILFERSKNSIALVACESHMLATVGVNAEMEGDARNVIVPGAFMSAAMAGLRDAEGDVTLGISDTSIRIECENSVAWSLLVEGAFPPWRDIISPDSSTVVKVPRKLLIEKINLAADAAADATDYKVIRAITFKVSDTGLKMEASSAIHGQSSAYLPCKVSGPDLVWSAKPDFWVAALSGMVGDEVELGWTSHNRPCKITCGEMVEIIMSIVL